MFLALMSFFAGVWIAVSAICLLFWKLDLVVSNRRTLNRLLEKAGHTTRV